MASAGRPRRLPCSRVLRETPATPYVQPRLCQAQGATRKGLAAGELRRRSWVVLGVSGLFTPEASRPSRQLLRRRGATTTESGARENVNAGVPLPARALGALARSDGAAAGGEWSPHRAPSFSSMLSQQWYRRTSVARVGRWRSGLGDQSKRDADIGGYVLYPTVRPRAGEGGGGMFQQRRGRRAHVEPS